MGYVFSPLAFLTMFVTLCASDITRQAQLSRAHAMLHVSLHISLGHTRSFEMTPLSRTFHCNNMSVAYLVQFLRYSVSNNSVTSKSRFGVVQGH